MIHVNLTIMLIHLFLFIFFLLIAEFPPNVVSFPNPHIYTDYTNTSLQTFVHKLRGSTKRHCSCGDALLQSRFCKQDFAIIAEVDTLQAEPFYGISPSPPFQTGWPYSGTKIPVRVLHSLKGNLKLDQLIHIVYMQGGTCGITSAMLPVFPGKYLVSGFRIIFSACKEFGGMCRAPHELLVVTGCGWSEPLEDVTITQIAGLFLGMYSCGRPKCTIQPSLINNSLSQNPNICSYNYKATRCYSQFSICTPVRNATTKGTNCQLRSVKRIPVSSKLFHLIPKDLHPKLRRSQNDWSNDENRFSTCMWHKIGN